MQAAAQYMAEGTGSPTALHVRLEKLDVMLSPREVARRLRRRKSWVFSMLRAGTWGAKRPNGRWEIPQSRVAAWWRQQPDYDPETFGGGTAGNRGEPKPDLPG